MLKVMDGQNEDDSHLTRRRRNNRDNDSLNNSESSRTRDSQRGRSAHDTGGLDFPFWLYVVVSIIIFYLLVHFWFSSCHSFRLETDTGDRSPAVFNSKLAQKTLVELTGLGPRVVGSRANEVLAREMLRQNLKSIQASVAHASQVKTELEVQVADQGTFSLGLFKSGVFASVYRNIANVLFRVHGKRWLQTNGTRPVPSLLVNCHYDTVVMSPGAGDNAVSCAVQMEVLRALLVRMAENSKYLPEYDVIFLFNSAEENLLQASHAFITKHRWAVEVKAFVNLDSAGCGGREVVFQTGPEHQWLVTEYARVAPYPFGTILGQEVFQSGAIPSDTDFRIFRDYGKIPGIDIAYISNGYVYHTPRDRPEGISLACLQRAGENLYALIGTLADSPQLETPGELAKGAAVFFDFLGLFMIVYSLPFATVMHLIIVGLLFSVMFVRYVKSRSLNLLGIGILALLGCLSFVFLAMMACAVIVTYVLHRPLSWYHIRFNLVGLYVFPMLSAFFSYWFVFLRYVLPPKFHSFVEGETNPVEDGALVLTSFLLLLGTFCATGSSFLLFLWLLFPFVMRKLFSFFLNRIHLIDRSSRSYNLIIHFTSLLIPFVFFIYCLDVILELFIPLFGRTFSYLVPDLVISVMLFFFFSLPILFLSPLASRSPQKVLRSLGAVAFHCSVAWLLLVTVSRYGEPYATQEWLPQKQRIIFIHSNREFREDPMRPDLVTRYDSGVWCLSLDYNRVPLTPEQRDEASPLICRGSEPYCGMPYLYPVASALKNHVYLRRPPHRHTPAPQLLVHSHQRLNASAVNMTFSVTGPPHTHIFFSVTGGVELLAWSVGDESKTGARPRPRSMPPGVTERHYFIYNSYGGEEQPEQPLLVWVVFGHDPKARLPTFRVAVAGHYLFGSATNGHVVAEVESAMPPTMNSLQWSSSYSMWTLRLDAPSEPIQTH